MYGLPEHDDKHIGAVVDAVCHSMGDVITKDKTIDCYRVGKKQEGKVRPVKLECQNRGDVDS